MTQEKWRGRKCNQTEHNDTYEKSLKIMTETSKTFCGLHAKCKTVFRAACQNKQEKVKGKKKSQKSYSGEKGPRPGSFRLTYV